jgi:hypothetical protein
MKRLVVIVLVGTVSLVASARVVFRHADAGHHTGATAQEAERLPGSVSGQTEVPRHGVMPRVPSPAGLTDTSEPATGLSPAASPPPSENETTADRTLDAFMDARMARSAAAAKPYLSATAYDQICDDPFCTRLVGTSNPHYVSWEVLSETAEGEGTVLFIVRIHEEITGEEHTDEVQESIEIGPGENFLGEHMDAIVLDLDQ